MDRAPSTETVDLDSFTGRVKPKSKNWCSQIPCLTFSNKRHSVKPPSYVVDRWKLHSKTERSLSSWTGEGNLANEDAIIIISPRVDASIGIRYL